MVALDSMALEVPRILAVICNCAELGELRSRMRAGSQGRLKEGIWEGGSQRVHGRAGDDESVPRDPSLSDPDHEGITRCCPPGPDPSGKNPLFSELSPEEKLMEETRPSPSPGPVGWCLLAQPAWPGAWSGKEPCARQQVPALQGLTLGQPRELPFRRRRARECES